MTTINVVIASVIRRAIQMSKSSEISCAPEIWAQVPGCIDTADIDQQQNDRLALESTRFGGLAGLRRKGFYKLVRVADPFTNEVRVFPKSLYADNWLVRVFESNAVCMTLNQPLQAIENGKLRTSRCALVSKIATKWTADCIVEKSDPQGEAKWGLFQRVARANRLEPALRTEDTIRRDVLLLQNYERMRQHLVQYVGNVGHHEKLKQRINLYMPSVRRTSLLNLCQSLEDLNTPAALIECAVILLCCEGSLKLNLSEACYGDQSTVQCV